MTCLRERIDYQTGETRTCASLDGPPCEECAKEQREGLISIVNGALEPFGGFVDRTKLAELDIYRLTGERDLATKHAEALLAELQAVKIERDGLRKALESVKAALGDRLLADGPLSEEYAHDVIREIKAALEMRK